MTTPTDYENPAVQRAALRTSAMNKVTAVKLPDTLSALIRVAVADMKKVAKLPGFRLDMSMWAYVNYNEECELCAAGAMLYCEAGLTKDEVDCAWPCGLNTEELAEASAAAKTVIDKMLAINKVRAAFDEDCFAGTEATNVRRTCIVNACQCLLPNVMEGRTEITEKCRAVFTDAWLNDHPAVSVSAATSRFYSNLLAAADLLASQGL